MVLEKIIVLLVDPSPGPVFAPLLVVELEILAPFKAICDAPIHIIFALVW